MLGFNGGLIGKVRDTSAAASVPGVWTPPEQLKAKRAGLWPSFAVREDANFSSVSLLLPCHGSSGSAVLTDYSQSTKVLTAYGAPQISVAQSKYYGSSAFFNPGETNGWSAPHDLGFTLSTGDWTIEAWVFLTANRSFNYLVSKGGATTREWALMAGPTNITMYWSTNGAGSGDQTISRAATLPLNTWMHIAASKSGSTIRLFKDGVQQGANGSFTSMYSGTSPLYVGRFADYTNISHDLQGYMNDVRITKGVARYTANFTPPNSFLL